MRSIVLIAWYFAVVFQAYGNGAAGTIGPFSTQRECEDFRRWAIAQVYSRHSVSHCWLAK